MHGERNIKDAFYIFGMNIPCGYSTCKEGERPSITAETVTGLTEE